jgi:hypothetical protein
MPIRINLLSEALAEEDLRRRDPVKRTIYMGAFFVVLSLVWFSSTWLEYMVDKGKLTRIQGAIQDRTNDYARVQGNLKGIADTKKHLDALDQLASARFLQGNLLNALQHTYVTNVQLVRLRVNQSSSPVPAVPARAGSAAAAYSPAMIQHVSLTMDAKDFSANPGDQVNHFKDALGRQEYFSHYLDASNGIRLSSLSALQTPSDNKPFVMFTLECRFLDKTP